MYNKGNNLGRRARSAQPGGGRPANISMLENLEDGITSAGRLTWHFFHDIPIQGALTSGAIGLYAATVFGVAELIAAGLSGYFAYRMFAFGEPLLVAVENTIKFEMGELPKSNIDRPRRKRQAVQRS